MRADRRPVDLGERFTDVEARDSSEPFAGFTAFDNTTGQRVSVTTVADPHSGWAAEALTEQAALLERLRDVSQVIALVGQVTLPHRRPALLLEHCARTAADLAPMPARDAVAIGVAMATGLDAVHRAGVLSCDVRPGTVLLRDLGEPVLAAFDHTVSYAAGESTAPVVTEPTAYTAPELLLAEGAVPATDVYGAAATLYALLTGHDPFRAAVGESTSATVAKILAGKAFRLTATDVPVDLADLLAWSLSLRPADRPPSPAWLAEELRRIQTARDWARAPLGS